MAEYMVEQVLPLLAIQFKIVKKGKGKPGARNKAY
jgi:hypothetical protein